MPVERAVLLSAYRIKHLGGVKLCREKTDRYIFFQTVRHQYLFSNNALLNAEQTIRFAAMACLHIELFPQCGDFSNILATFAWISREILTGSIESWASSRESYVFVHSASMVEYCADNGIKIWLIFTNFLIGISRQNFVRLTSVE